MSKRLGTNVIVVVRPGATPADHDTLDPRGLGFASAADVLNHTESGSNAVIHVGAESVTLLSVDKNTLAAHSYALMTG